MDRKEHTQPGWEEKPNQSDKDFDSTPNLIYSNKDFDIKGNFRITDQEMSAVGIGQKFSRTKVSSALYSAAATDYLIGITNLGVAPTIGLPRPKLAGMGKTYIVKDEVGGAGSTTITIVSQGSETIDGAASATLASNYASKSFYTDGANWFVF